jgi:hypothetical protein
MSFSGVLDFAFATTTIGFPPCEQTTKIQKNPKKLKLT